MSLQVAISLPTIFGVLDLICMYFEIIPYSSTFSSLRRISFGEKIICFSLQVIKTFEFCAKSLALILSWRPYTLSTVILIFSLAKIRLCIFWDSGLSKVPPSFFQTSSTYFLLR